MRYYSKRFTVYYYPQSPDSISIPALIVHFFISQGSIRVRRHFRSAHMPHQATINVRILPDTHLYTWVESSNVDKVSCWRTKKVPGIYGNRTCNPLVQSQGFNPIYHGTSAFDKGSNCLQSHWEYSRQPGIQQTQVFALGLYWNATELQIKANWKNKWNQSKNKF